MANPPFNVDEIDADKVKTDPRLPFGLPGVNKNSKVSNGNYVWISYFYSYLNEHDRAGFVMSSQASSAGGGEAKVRQKLVETGAVDLMIAIRSNFFYTRTVPCELWFLNRNKPEEHQDKVLMIDARSIYRKVTRKIYDFSPEQERNLLAIVWLYRGQTDRYLDLVSNYCRRTLEEAAACFGAKGEKGDPIQPLQKFASAIDAIAQTLEPVQKTFSEDEAHAYGQKELAEDMGFEVLHGIVDCLWVIGEPISMFKEAVERETGILTEVDSYDWIAFLPMSDGTGAYNRYFGRLNTGKMKIRGVMARKGDTPEYVNKMQQEIFQVLAEARSLEDLRRIEPKAREVYRRYMDGLNGADVKDLAIHRRVSKINYSRRCAESSAVKAHMKQGLPLAPGMQIGYVVKDAHKWEVDPERTASKFDACYYRGLLEKAWEEAAFVFKQTNL